jgi:hypothetical protein
MKKIQILRSIFLSLFVLLPLCGYSQIYSFKGGVRIPAGSCVTHSNTPKAELTGGSGIGVFNYDGAIDVTAVCSLPVPEGALVRQFVAVGNATKGTVTAEIGAILWNVPRQYSQKALVQIDPNTPYEVPEMKQKKAVQNLPTTGTGVLKIDRIQTYFIQAHLYSSTAIPVEEALELFYFEVYWD